MFNKLVFLSFLFIFIAQHSQAQKNPSTDQAGIYVDQSGVMRWKSNQQEATFFGVNYTAPFAYGFRSIQRTGISVEQAIKDDVYHFSRLGLDAFRVHVWDTEISDSVGNLLQNEHLRLFDFLIAELKKRKIKTLVTPIAFWGNGYPEEDVDRGGFSSKYGKKRALVEEKAFLAQERYLAQFFKHKNQYTGLTYQEDPDIIAAEVNNEPQHSGPAARTTEYINRMVKAIRGTGWTKPVFYNISESPDYAAAAVKADVDGHSFQWYPTGLVAGRTLKGNFLPNVARYTIPFDSIPGFKNRAKMVYEFDAGDVLDAYMYPAMAKSFRVAGFQWATQFAYDPMATADANTEYQTHFLNLAYTPAKAISLLIAAQVFHQLPRAKTQAADTSFGAFKIKYATASSEMNSTASFYYSASTKTQPLEPKSLKHIAGVGNSVLVQTNGSGAYFLDKLDNGLWRLELMPNAEYIRDPFGKAAADRIVSAINWNKVNMILSLPDLGTDFIVKALNAGNELNTIAGGGRVELQPGTYLIVKKGKKHQLTSNSPFKNGRLGEFVAPQATVSSVIEQARAEKEITTAVPGKEVQFTLFNPGSDQGQLMIYNPDWKNNTIAFQADKASAESTVKINMATQAISVPFGFQIYFGDKLKTAVKLEAYTTLVLRVKALNGTNTKMRIGLIDTEANFFATDVMASAEWKEIAVPLNSLAQNKQLILPRPYPGFLPLYYQSAAGATFDLKRAEKLELLVEQGIELGSIYLK